MSRNRRYNKNTRRDNYPTPVQRVDDILAAEVRLALQLGLSDDTIVKNYHITYSQLNYCKKKKNVSFNDYYKIEEDE